MTGFRWTIKRKLLALGGGTLLPLLLLLGSWVWWEVRERTGAAEAELTLASQQAAGQLEATFREREVLVTPTRSTRSSTRTRGWPRSSAAAPRSSVARARSRSSLR